MFLQTFFVTTKMILVAAPASDRKRVCTETLCCPRNFAQVLLCTVLLKTCLIFNIFCLGFYFRTLAVNFVSGQVKQTILK